MIDDELICSICNKPMESVEWIWDDENAHKECALELAEYQCAECGRWFEVTGEGCCDVCGGTEWKKLTAKDKEAIKNDPKM